MHPKEEKTCVLIKPDGVKRGLIGEVISRIESRGLKIIAAKMLWPSKKFIDQHYPKDYNWIRRLGENALKSFEKYNMDVKKSLGTADPDKIGLEVRNWLLEYMTSGPILAMVVKGIHAIDMVRKICGPTIPAFAEMGTIRGDYSVDAPTAANTDKRAIHNLVHASETAKEAENEIKHWFSQKEIHDYKRAEEDIMF